MAGSADKPLNRSQFENLDTISRFQYVNTGKITIPNSDGEALSAATMSPPAVPYRLNGSNEAISANKHANLPTDAMGVYSAYPSMSPKYVKHNSGTLAVNLGGLARIYIPVSREDYLKRIYDSFKKRNKSLEKVSRRVFGLGKDGGDATGAGYVDFVLMSVSQALDEKFQVTEVLEDNYVAFFFGQRAPMWTFSGALMNTYQDDWTMNMWRLYSEMGRGTRLAQRGLLMSIRYDSVIISGGMTRFQWELSSSNELFTSFSFQFLVNNITPLRGSFCPPTELPVIYKGFYDVDIDFEALNTYEGVMPVINPSDKDPSVNDQTAATSLSTAEPSLEDVNRGIGAYGGADSWVNELYRVADEYGKASNAQTLDDLGITTADSRESAAAMSQANARALQLDSRLR